MNKRVFGWRLGRDRNSRKALFRSLIRALVINGKIETTEAKAKAVRREIDQIINWLGKDPVLAKRAVMSKLGNDKEVVNKLFTRKPNFVRVMRLPARRGDNAPMVRMELVELAKKEPKKLRKKYEDIPT